MYIDKNCVIWIDTTFGDHIELFNKVLSWLVDAGMKCNSFKYKWAVEETDFFKYWVILTANKPIKIKVNGV